MLGYLDSKWSLTRMRLLICENRWGRGGASGQFDDKSDAEFIGMRTGKIRKFDVLYLGFQFYVLMCTFFLSRVRVIFALFRDVRKMGAKRRSSDRRARKDSRERVKS